MNENANVALNAQQNLAEFVSREEVLLQQGKGWIWTRLRLENEFWQVFILNIVSNGIYVLVMHRGFWSVMNEGTQAGGH